MRVFGRITNPNGSKTWVTVQTTASGSNDYVYLTALCQVCQLSLSESPFYANNGLPAQQVVMQQVYPDYYMMLIQQQYAPFFASLIISRQPDFTPTYAINITTHSGVKLNASVQVPM